MLMQAICEFHAKIELRCVSPLLIKEGRFTQQQRENWVYDKADREIMPSAIPISLNTEDEIKAAVMRRNDTRGAVNALRFYIPGSSMRGAWRSHLERTLRGFDLPNSPRVCDPLDDHENEVTSGCSTTLDAKRKEFLKAKQKFPAYELSCPVCKLFGNLTQAGRLSISDGVRIGTEGGIVEREHVRINRRNGQVIGAPLRFYGLQGARFQVDIRIRNFELWQILLMGTLLAELGSKLVPLGSGKNKGYGQVEAVVNSIELTSFGLAKPDDKLRGIAEHEAMGTTLQRQYGLQAADTVPTLGGTDWNQLTPWRWQRSLDRAAFDSTWKQLKLPWGAFGLLSQRTERKPVCL